MGGPQPVDQSKSGYDAGGHRGGRRGKRGVRPVDDLVPSTGAAAETGSLPAVVGGSREPMRWRVVAAGETGRGTAWVRSLEVSLRIVIVHSHSHYTSTRTRLALSRQAGIQRKII